MEQNSCYPMAFGLSTISMLISLGIFCSGIYLYKPVNPSENVILRALNAIKVKFNTYKYLTYFRWPCIVKLKE
jgi:hypothetical protein